MVLVLKLPERHGCSCLFTTCFQDSLTSLVEVSSNEALSPDSVIVEIVETVEEIKPHVKEKAALKSSTDRTSCCADILCASIEFPWEFVEECDVV